MVLGCVYIVYHSLDFLSVVVVIVVRKGDPSSLTH